MNNYSNQERAAFYVSAGLEYRFPGSMPHVGADGRLQAIWFGGQDYRGSGYHGSFPPNYLQRIDALFPDAERKLHLFSGSLPAGPYDRLDIRKELEAEIHGDAERLSSLVTGQYDWIHADPPYTESDALKYGSPMVDRNRVVREAALVTRPGGFLIWMDMVLPIYRKEDWSIEGVIGIVRSTNHRFRCVTLFRRL